MAAAELQRVFRKKYGCLDFKDKSDELKNSETDMTSVIKGEPGNLCDASYKVRRSSYDCSKSHHKTQSLESYHILQFRDEWKDELQDRMRIN